MLIFPFHLLDVCVQHFPQRAKVFTVTYELILHLVSRVFDEGQHEREASSQAKQQRHAFADFLSRVDDPIVDLDVGKVHELARIERSDGDVLKSGFGTGDCRSVQSRQDFILNV